MIVQRTSARPLLPLLTLLCGTFLSHPTLAQVSSRESGSAASEYAVEPLVVTARKQTEDIQVIPESVTAIDSRTIAAAHLTRLDDFNSLVTNVNITKRADNTPDVVMRGVGSLGVVQGVGFYVNDVPQFEGQSVRPTDVERIEVLKGPQGTIFGGSNVGGAIKYVTTLPSETPSGEAQVEYGSFDHFTVDGVVSGAIVPGRLLGRVSVFHDQSDGYLFDPTLNIKVPRTEETGGRLTLMYPGDNTKVIFYLMGDRISGEDFNLYYTPPDDHTYLRVYKGGVDGTKPFYKRTVYSPSLQITHDFDDITFTSVSSYFHSKINSVGNLDKGAFPELLGSLIFINYPQDFGKNVWSQEFRLSSSGDSSFKWLLGAFFQDIRSDAVQSQIVGIAATLGSPVGETILDRSTVAYRHTNRDYAVFGNATYDLGDLTLEAGLRVAHFSNAMNDTTGQCGPCSGKVQETDLLPRASVQYHVSQDVMTYFTVARGDEQADLTDNPSDSGNQVLPFQTEFALSYEAGVKSSLFDRRLTLNAAVFFIDYTNRLFEVGKVDPATGGLFTYVANVGSSNNYGFEVEAKARPTPELTLSGGVGVTRAIFGSVFLQDGTGATVNPKGNQGPATPEYQATLAADWRHPLSGDMVLNARVDSRFVGRSFWSAAGCVRDPLDPESPCPFNGFRSEQRPYQVVNLGATLDIGTRFTIGAHVSNVFDVKYNTFYADQAVTGAPYNIAGLNQPREWLVSLAARF
jgi:iron complex outermembrane receptor protein